MCVCVCGYPFRPRACHSLLECRQRGGVGGERESCVSVYWSIRRQAVSLSLSLSLLVLKPKNKKNCKKKWNGQESKQVVVLATSVMAFLFIFVYFSSSRVDLKFFVVVWNSPARRTLVIKRLCLFATGIESLRCVVVTFYLIYSIPNRSRRRRRRRRLAELNKDLLAVSVQSSQLIQSTPFASSLPPSLPHPSIPSHYYSDWSCRSTNRFTNKIACQIKSTIRMASI